MPRKPFHQKQQGANLNPKDATNASILETENENTKSPNHQRPYSCNNGWTKPRLEKKLNKAASGVMEFGENSNFEKHLHEHVLSFGTNETTDFLVSRPYFGQNLPIHFLPLSMFSYLYPSFCYYRSC